MHDHCASSASAPEGHPKLPHITPKDRLVLFLATRLVSLTLFLDKSIIIINAERPSSVDLALCSDCPPRPQHPAAASLVFIFEQSVTLLPVCLTRQETAT